MLILVVAATLGGAPPQQHQQHQPERIVVRLVWDEPQAPPPEPSPFDCDDRAYAANNADKCGLPGPFLLGGGAPRGRGLIGSILGALGL